MAARYSARTGLAVSCSSLAGLIVTGWSCYLSQMFVNMGAGGNNRPTASLQIDIEVTIVVNSADVIQYSNQIGKKDATILHYWLR